MTKDFTTEFIKSIPRNHNVTSFRFADPDDVGFRPGQFFQLFLDRDGEEIFHYFSFSNSPTEKGYLEFTKKMSDSPYSRLLKELVPGDTVRIKMPMGQFIYEGEPPRAAFLSGGIGITPIRSICGYLTDTGSTADVSVLYSARTEADFVFRRDFDEMEEQHKNMAFTYFITEEVEVDHWAGQVGRIDAEAVRLSIPDYDERVFYVCGPPAMVGAMTAMLKDDLALASEKIILENFMGY